MRHTHIRGLLAVVGGALLSVASLAHAAPFAYITQQFSNTVAVVDVATNTVVTTVTVGFSPTGVAVHPSGSHVYVTNSDDNSVSVIEVASNAVVATIELLDQNGVPQSGPAGLAVHPSGSHVYVANELADSVSVIATATNTVVGTVTMEDGLGDGPRGVAVNPAGTRLYVVNNLSFTLSVIDTTTLGVVATVGVGQRPVGVALDPAGARVYVTNAMSSTLTVLNAADHSLVETVPVDQSPRGVAVHPSGSHVYVATGAGRIVVVSAASNTVVANPLAAAGLFGISVTSSGGQVHAASQMADAVYVLDTATNTVAPQAVTVGDGPTAFGVFITPEAGGAPCDTTALEQALAEARRQVGALEAANQALIAEKGRLQTELGTVRATIESFVDKLLGDEVDGRIAAAARAVALSELNAARAAAPHSWRVRHAQHSFDQGEKALRKRDWRRAVREYREVHQIVEWIVRSLPRTPDGTTTVVGGPSTAGPGMPSTNPDCDTSALEQLLAAALRQIALLQAANQSLTAENVRLQSELAAAKAVVTSFVMRLLGERTDGNVAAAVRDAARDKLEAAQAAAAHDRRLRLAHYSFDQGQQAMRKHDWGRAVHAFRESHEMSARILKDKRTHRHR